MASQHDDIIISAESVIFKNDVLKLPSHRILHEIGRGANGVVLLCQNIFLERNEAVKIWLKLRARDSRDKFAQGMHEARKATAAAGEYIPQIYSAGVLLERYFYASMYPVPGMTAALYLNRAEAGLSGRGAVARSYIKALRRLSDVGLVHGDPHLKNVMVYGSIVHSEIGLNLLDFGTSHFTAPEKFVERHWSVVHESMANIFRRHPSFLREARKLRHNASDNEQLAFYWEVTRKMLDIGFRYGLEPYAPDSYPRDDLLEGIV